MVSKNTNHVDVAIIGGGPAGTTVASLLRKYDPSCNVLIIEKEKFPRDHVGESQLPGVSHVLHEMGCWEKVEAAGFPIKIGASYTWGQDAECWDFDFFPIEDFTDEPRPANFQGQRTSTAFQVDRYVYDEILLRHAQEMGASVREETRVAEIHSEGDRVTGFELHTGETITADVYVDASGAIGLLRRAMGVTGWEPKELRNIAIWDYWRNAEWAVEIGVGATRVQVRSLPYGWLWFIPLGPDRTSIGLITPADHYKSMGKSPEELYLQAIGEQDSISELTANAEREGPVQSCKDWSNLADRVAGENWFLAGECCGFADPILAAGMNLAHQSSRDCAYTILEGRREMLHPEWLRERYNDRTRNNIRQHIRFAQYWYAANGCFTDLQEHCTKIAKEAGLSLSAGDAWRWLAQGGFANETPGLPLLGSFDINTARQVLEVFDVGVEGQTSADHVYEIDKYNTFRLNLKGAEEDVIGVPKDGRIEMIHCHRRGDATLPNNGWYEIVIEALQRETALIKIVEYLRARIPTLPIPKDRWPQALDLAMQTLESMALEGWAIGNFDPKLPKLKRSRNPGIIRSTAAGAKALEKRNRAKAR